MSDFFFFVVDVFHAFTTTFLPPSGHVLIFNANVISGKGYGLQTFSLYKKNNSDWKCDF